MKLRLYGDSLRLRLSRDEADQLARLGAVESSVHFSPHRKLTYALRTSAIIGEIAASFEGETVLVQVPEKVARSWAEGHETGISATQKLGSEHTLKILIEKDFECLDASKNEPGIALFPNPSAKHV